MTTMRPADLPLIVNACLEARPAHRATVRHADWPRTLSLLESRACSWLAVRVCDHRGVPVHWIVWSSGTVGAPWLRFERVGELTLRRELLLWLAYRRPDEVMASEGLQP